MKNFSPLHVVVAALVADPTLPVKLRLRALQASHRLRFGVVGPDEERWLRRLHAWRRRQLEVAARAYGVGRPR